MAALVLLLNPAQSEATDDVDLVKDINPGPSDSFGSPFGELAPEKFEGDLYFPATDGSQGGLWRTGGTPETTELVHPGVAPTRLQGAGGQLFFRNGNAPGCRFDESLELWRSDGTTGGSFAVGDFGCPSYTLDWFASVGGVLYFNASAPSGGLWRSDGTEAGTTLVKGFEKSNELRSLAEAGGKLFFTANDGIHGLELWVSDGSPEGTQMVKDINPGPGDSGAYHPIEFNGSLMFGAYDGGRRGTEVWLSDGTAAGTQLLANLRPGAESSRPRHFTQVEDQVFFTAEDDRGTIGLWRTDGTAEGTRIVRKGFDPGFERPTLAEAEVVGDTLYFPGYHGRKTSTAGSFRATRREGVELWRSRGTRRSTKLVRDFVTDTFYPPSSPRGVPRSTYPRQLTAVRDAVYFVGYENTQSGRATELYRSDGTANGTYAIRAPTESGFFNPNGLTRFRRSLFFAGSGEEGRELWRAVPTGP
ncbi:MAG: hypothetical protein M3Y34_05180 [Actinomycetota bacterium]|nr:hypothetical protein [Actinomycetota bacterium]